MRRDDDMSPVGLPADYRGKASTWVAFTESMTGASNSSSAG
jgi:hypothetical protein